MNCTSETAMPSPEAAIQLAEKFVHRFAHPIEALDYEDVQQELFLAVLEARKKFNPDKKTSFSTYIYKILEHRIKELYRFSMAEKRGHKTKTISIDGSAGTEVETENLTLEQILEGTSMEEQVREEQVRVAINKAISKQPNALAKKIAYLHSCGCTQSEIAIRCSCSQPTVNRYVKIFRANIKNQLEDWG